MNRHRHIPSDSATESTLNVRTRFHHRVRAWLMRASSSHPIYPWASVAAARGEHFERSFADMKLSEMTGLDVDWAAEGSEPPNAHAYANAKEVLTVIDILEIPVEYVTASVSGGIVVCLKRGEVYADVECFNSDEIWAVVSDHVATPQSWQIGTARAEIVDALQKISSVMTPEYA